MRIGKARFAALAGGMALAVSVVPAALAQCGGFTRSAVHPTGWNSQLGTVRLLRASLGGPHDDDNYYESPSIVGFWHVRFVSDGISTGIPGGVPKGAPVDAGYSQWHSDGTEIMNSGGRAPNTSDFCLGVWTKVGPRAYKLNHFTTGWDPTKGSLDSAGNPVGQLIGPGTIHESVSLSADGNSFIGSFAIDQYDPTGKVVLVHLEGTITGSRITVNTPVSPVF